jgi:hypothetical protein
MAHQLQTISDAARKLSFANVAHLMDGVLQKLPVIDGC